MIDANAHTEDLSVHDEAVYEHSSNTAK